MSKKCPCPPPPRTVAVWDAVIMFLMFIIVITVFANLKEMSEEDQANLKEMSEEVDWGVIIALVAAMIFFLVFLLVYHFATVRNTLCHSFISTLIFICHFRKK